MITKWNAGKMPPVLQKDVTAVKMNTLTLPVTEPFVKVYPKHAIPFSILSGRESFEHWLSCNYIQLRCSKTYLEHTPTDFLDFYTVYPEFYENPCLRSERMSITTITNFHSDIAGFFTQCLHMGFYIYTHVDEQFIPDSVAHQRTLPHAILIYGCDEENQSFDFAGFNKTGTFTFRKTSFDIIQKAFSGLVDYSYGVNNLIGNYYEYTYLLKPVEESGYAFDFEWMMDGLRDYITSSNTSGRFRGYSNADDDFYGISVYDHLAHFYRKLPSDPRSTDVRPLYLLWEHKKCMLARIEYLSRRRYLGDSFNEIYRAYKEIESLSLSNQNLLLKYIFSKNKIY